MRVDWPVASALARARMLGRVWTWIHSVDELRPGDHIAFNTGAVYYYQHAIVTRLQGIYVNIMMMMTRQIVMLSLVKL